MPTRSITTQPYRPPGPTPAPNRLRPSSLAGAAAGLVAVVTLVWANKGGWHELAGGPAEWWRPLASLTGLWTSLCGIFGLVLAARLRWMERTAGLDRLLTWHRIAGDTMGLLLVAHIVTSVMAEKQLRGGLGDTIADLTRREPYMALTTVGTLAILVVVVSSLKAIRNRMNYETWYFLHLTVYLGLAVSVPHQITLGSTLSSGHGLRVLWVGLSVAAYAVALFGRWWKVLGAAIHPLKVGEIRQETPSTRSITLTGRQVRRLGGEAGQFVTVRALTRDQWWKVNPFSLSALPDGRSLRITVKDRGDSSGGLHHLRTGDWVAVEGPYGAQTADVLAGKRPLLIAGGVGVTPILPILQSLPADSRPVVLLRARRADDIPHLAEITALTDRLGGKVRTVTGTTSSLGRDPFSGDALRRAVGRLDGFAAIVYGPPSLLRAAHRGLQHAGMPRADIHMELPWW